MSEDVINNKTACKFVRNTFLVVHHVIDFGSFAENEEDNKFVPKASIVKRESFSTSIAESDLESLNSESSYITAEMFSCLDYSDDSVESVSTFKADSDLESLNSESEYITAELFSCLNFSDDSVDEDTSSTDSEEEADSIQSEEETSAADETGAAEEPSAAEETGDVETYGNNDAVIDTTDAKCEVKRELIMQILPPSNRLFYFKCRPLFSKSNDYFGDIGIRFDQFVENI